MIPDFKTYIKESIWSDIQDRSGGDVVRKEDDVDILDREGLVDYLKNHYTGGSNNWLLISPDMGGMISIDLFEDQVGYDCYLIYDDIEGDSEISILGGLKHSAKYIYDELKSKYTTTIRKHEDINNHPYEDIIIEPKGCRYIKLTNSFFLEVLDFILERIDKPLKKQIEKK